MCINGLVYPPDHLILQYFFQSTSIVKSKWGVLTPRINFPEYTCLKVMRLIHVPHIRHDDITIIYIFKNLYYVMSSTTITPRIYGIFFSFRCTQFNHFPKITKLNSKIPPRWRLLSYEHFRQCGIQKKSQHHLRLRNGGVWFLIKPAGYSRDQRGIFLNGRGICGILAGYLNYWRPNLPQYVIRWLSKCIMICFEYHK